ncbi:Thiosulfate sulfurtransferase glpE [Kingella potus]|uniref:Thiosulfate sulfurtransferase glpE n=1 Tax=Kingella potus TaxID=265175 RepID=A0A377R1X3_9NEIS|nr:rhodanese-like domain-containing protein [Kingella potus]UOP01072.1 sulfurtransferase [Kingella potus]STR00758.1 Thiosulfate sulfurtransferase glpE [Kingella potus]
MTDIIRITAHELENLLAQQPDTLLLDVREPEETALCALPGSVSIPMGELAARHNELPDGCPIVVYCAHGIRSQYCALFLADAGFSPLYNLTGGIDAWMRDTGTVPRA